MANFASGLQWAETAVLRAMHAQSQYLSFFSSCRPKSKKFPFFTNFHCHLRKNRQPAAVSILMPPIFPIASFNRYTSKFSGAPQKLTWCQQFGSQVLPKWGDANFWPLKRAVFRCFYDLINHPGQGSTFVYSMSPIFGKHRRPISARWKPF